MRHRVSWESNGSPSWEKSLFLDQFLPPVKQNYREWRPGIDTPDSEKVLESFLSLFNCIVSH